MKVFYGCNLKCEVCNHWRDRREPSISADRFKEVPGELAGLGTKKIHISGGGEPMLGPHVPELVEQTSAVSRTNYQTLETLPDLAHELGADGINLILVDDHRGEVLSMRKKDIALFNEKIAPKLAERAITFGLMISDEDAFPFGRSGLQVRLGCAGR